MDIRTTSDIKAPATHLASVIASALRLEKRTLFLIPGGSAIPVVRAVSEGLKGEDLSRLSIMQTDERYGDVGHRDSNWAQIFSGHELFSGATLLPVLLGEPFDVTVSRYDRDLMRELSNADLSVGLFGMGADGHTAGILPHTDAVSADTFAFGYDTPTYKRVTMTPLAIGEMKEAVLFAMGKEKAQGLARLKEEGTVSDAPVRALLQAEILTVFTDAV